MKSFITGINGFVGVHLARALVARGDAVSGVYHPDTSAGELKRECPHARISAIDILDAGCLRDFLRRIRPDHIYHLAAQSHVPTSWKDPAGTFRVNVLGTLNLIEAAARKANPPRLLLVSSGDVYGDATNIKAALKENSPINPRNPYAASKAAAEWMGRIVAESKKMPLVCVRPFNHIGPGQAPTFVASDFAQQIALIEARRAKPRIRVGNLDVRKDFTDVRDMIRAYMLAIEKAHAGQVYNLCSGKSYTIREILDVLVNLGAVKPKIILEQSRLRPSWSNVVRASAAPFTKLTGWKPQYSIRQTLADILEYWRERVQSE